LLRRRNIARLSSSVRFQKFVVGWIVPVIGIKTKTMRQETFRPRPGPGRKPRPLPGQGGRPLPGHEWRLREGRTKRTTDTKERLIRAGVDLFKRQGLNATAVKEILGQANARSSSLYHFFPGGKDELAAEVIAAAGSEYQQLVEGIWDSESDAVRGVREIFEVAADVLETSDYADICSIGTLAHEVAGTHNELRMATADVFESWIDSASARLVEAGATVDDAGTVAQTLIAMLEGSFILCRTIRSIDPMRDAARVAAYLVRPVLKQKKTSYLVAEPREQVPAPRQ
jgi:AcrR family transcriptional regulator